MGEPLNHIHQDTKSARLITVCKRSLKSYLLSVNAAKFLLVINVIARDFREKSLVVRRPGKSVQSPSDPGFVFSNIPQ